ncbi:MAG: hypothetical protein ACM37W_13905 [Actinomycetota bacterium]
MITFETHFTPLQEVLASIVVSGSLSDKDFNLLSLALGSEVLNEEEKRAVKRVFYALRRGSLTLSGISERELSAIQSWVHATVFHKRECDSV